MPLSVFAAADDAPDHPALVAAGDTLTYAELAGLARGVIARLRDEGLDRAPLLALVATNEPGTIVVLHALLALGVPVLVIHPRLTPGERKALIGRHEPACLLDAGWAEPGGNRAPDGEDAPDPPALPDDDRPLAILSTSGTTGRPRSVVLSRRAFAASATASAANLGWRDDDRWLLRLPVAHVGGLSVVTRCLLARRTVVLSDDADARGLTETIDGQRITLLSLVPTLLGRLLDLEPTWDPPARVRAILLGGAAASPALLTRAADRGWPVLTTYGLTEACSQVTTQDYGTVNRGQLGSGRPLAGTEIRIAEDDEIQVRGPTLLTGYAGEDGALEEPFVDDDWFPTGDRGRLDADGNLHVLGRRTDRIVTGGENVDPLEVERALERMPGVKQATVFGVADDEWGAVVCAAVVPGQGFDREAVAAALRRDLAPFKRPRRLAVLDALPTNANGKVDRTAAARAATPRLEPLQP